MILYSYTNGAMFKMKYLIYQITNIINGKIYIGAHATLDENDGYMGSGVNIKKSIKKYGIHNFKKEILYSFSSSEEMYKMEALLVNEEFVMRTDTYNAAIGGRGNPVIVHLQDPSYRNMLSIRTKEGMTVEAKRKISKAKTGVKQSDETIAKRVKGRNEYYKTHVHPRKNKPISISHRKAISEKLGGIKKFIPICIKGVKFDNPDYAAEHFKVSPKTIRNWINADDMPDCYRIK
ncbi:putative homing endonuclease [Escherichia phage AugustSocin]|nr:homing endonuclease [Yersinia phage PYps10T]QXV76220.1 putative homing endonuclease [Escherichia phage AugustSocin]QXV84747.1 putative homing endonuclease [Escherichia phage TadeuszReichstein]